MVWLFLVMCGYCGMWFCGVISRWKCRLFWLKCVVLFLCRWMCRKFGVWGVMCLICISVRLGVSVLIFIWF